MSLYTFAAANLTTPDDRKRRPLIDKGQATRIVAFWLILVAALTLMSYRQSHAALGPLANAAGRHALPSNPS